MASGPPEHVASGAWDPDEGLRVKDAGMSGGVPWALGGHLGLGTSMGWLSPVTLLFQLRDESQGTCPARHCIRKPAALLELELWSPSACA